MLHKFFRNFIVILFIFSPTINALGQLKINEIMSNNVSAVIDDTYNYSMWVEVFNSHASETENIRDYYFTDDLNEPKKWRPPSRRIGPKALTVLWFERDDRLYHANFKLNPEGGVLYLMDSNDNIIDQIKYPKQYRNVSYGRIQDGSSDWVYFSEHSHAGSNNGKKWSNRVCTKPEFKIQGGFYSSGVAVTFEAPVEGETIYYTVNGAEPNTSSSKYNVRTGINITKTTVIRAISIADNKISSEISSATYFINERQFDLPVASFITEQKNLTDNTIGIYVGGTNGIPGNGTNSKVNWNQDWDRPTNFELFDVEGNTCLNQELDISIAGGWSRTINPQKSLKISPRKKFGDNRLRYDIFWASKPFRKYKGIQIRNSGNDFSASMMRDGFMQTLIANRMDIDYQAYQPAICFMNGVYYGIQNLRERSNKQLIYSNYGLSEEEFYLIDHENISREPFATTLNFVRLNNVADATVYNQVTELIDIDNLIDYYIAQMFFNNTDWPHNNLKTWRKIDNGKWRWIIYDTDFGFNLNGNHNDNITNHVQNAGDPSSLIFKRLLLNTKFKTKFLSRAAIHFTTTFETHRVNQIMDSLSNAIRTEIPYHKQRWGSADNFDQELNKMKLFAEHRPNIMMKYFGERYAGTQSTHTINISSNIERARYTLNGELVSDNEAKLQYFHNHTIKVEPDEIVGYEFKHWRIYSSMEDVNIINLQANWHYWDKYGIPAANWYSSNYSTSSWKEGKASFGYGSNFPDVSTTVSYGNNANDKYPTCYFRKNFTIENRDELDDFKVSTYVDDGIIIYVNGTEIGRYNMPGGAVDFFTHSVVYNNGEWVNFNVPKSLIKNGENIIAAEVHQVNKTSSDMVFDLSLKANKSQNGFRTNNKPLYTVVLNSDVKIQAIFDEVEVIDPYEYAQIFINEVVSSNTFVQDEFDEFDDYIELYNAGDEDVNIGGWYLSDTPVNPLLSPIPNTDAEKTVIPAKGRIIVWADEQPEQGVLHADFKINKEGEPILLSRKNPFGEIILVDQVMVPALDKDMSYSRNPDGSDNWLVQIPTFNHSNSDISDVEEQKTNPLVFPTLVSNYFYISDSAGEDAYIIDLSGKLLFTHHCVTDYEHIEVSWLQKGAYLVKIGTQTVKIIKTY